MHIDWSGVLSKYVVYTMTVVVISLALAACSQSPPSKLELYKQSLERSAEVRSGRATQIMAISTPQGINRLYNDVEFNDLGLRISVRFGSADGEQTQVISLPPYFYMKLPRSDWLRMGTKDLESMGNVPIGAMVDPSRFRRSIFSIEADTVTPGTFKIASLGLEVIDGVEVEHLDVEMDFQAWLSSLSDEDFNEFHSTMFGESSPGPSEEFKQLLSQASFEKYEVWVDGQANTRRTRGRMVLGDFSMEFDQSFYDINESISIQPPSEFTQYVP